MYYSILLYSALALFVIFLVSYLSNPYRLFNGFVFDGALFFLLAGLFFLSEDIPGTATYILFLIIFVLVAFIALFGIFLLLGFLIWKNIQLVRNEGGGLSNRLSLILLILINAQIVAGLMILDIPTYSFVWGLYAYLIVLEAYFVVILIAFLTMVFLVNVFRQRKSCDYVVVLGSGLINGREVSVLLGNRIKRAIRFYKRQKAAGKTPPVLVFSGGQGRDEDLPEGEAMAQFAREYGIPESNIIVEGLSLNTQQNFEFSKKLMDERSDSYTAAFATSSYHVFRAGVDAKKAGIRMNGLGAKTASYFAQNALIREFVAMIAQHWKLNAVMVGLITIGYWSIWIAGIR